MPPGIVDRLEVIKVEDQETHRLAIAGAAGQFLAQGPIHVAAVVEPRQGIADRQLGLPGKALLQGPFGFFQCPVGLRQRPVSLLQFRQGLVEPHLRQAAFGDVGDETLQRLQLAGGIEDPLPLLPDPFLSAIGGANPIGQLKGPLVANPRLHPFPDQPPIGRMDQIGITARAVANQFRGGIAGQALTALAQELHGPIGIIPAAVGNPWQIADERLQPPAVFIQSGLRLAAFGDIEAQHGQAANEALVVEHRIQGILDTPAQAFVLETERLPGLDDLLDIGPAPGGHIRWDEGIDRVPDRGARV